ncbi:OmpA family protein [Psychrobacter phenylpyruvicus]|uniref:Inner membrane lipoprotein YiaD n=1 Tax=Psychrobacter phenylpyruvicus TaxID=29432 RepID=A0A379LJ20_9GAMM|nr:OmpA family protein [Psychrobacter phenylpyruvicus]SUD89784.1 Inner membrane lipoprotein YiaD precursor [Psychrobacter phenylpyruvicus]
MNNKLMIAALASSLALAGCATDPVTGQQTVHKGALGALGGAAAGAGISKVTGGSKTGRDAAIGAVLGGAIGTYMENQQRQLEREMAGTGVEVKHDGQGNIDLIMPGNITFAHDSTSINPSFYNTLDKLASTMNQYDQTTVTVMGHTDSVGNPTYNQGLSQRRAQSVAGYLVNRGVSSYRIQTLGYGQSQPIADNSTEQGRMQNRRVEIKLNAPQNLR